MSDDYPLPSFLAPRADEYDYDEPGVFAQELRSTSGVLKASILTVAMAVGGIAIALSLGHPARVLADARASLSDNSDLQREASQAPQTIAPAADTRPVQSSADAQSSAPAAEAPLTQAELAAFAQLANQARAENNEAASGALLEQFQAWAAKQDAQTLDARAEQPAEPAEAAPVQIARDEPAPEEAVQRHRKASSLRDARAEMPRVQKPRAKVQRKLAARREAAPIQDARAQELPVPNAQQPSFLQNLGWNQ